MAQAIISYPLAAGGVVTRVLECGSGSTPVVLIHGLGARADRWARNLPAIAEAGGRAYAVDLPGHGFAEKRAAFPHGVAGYRDFVDALLDTLELQRAAVIGTSLGGHVAAALAVEYPERVSGLMLVGATGLFTLGTEARERLARRAVDRTRAGIESKMRTVFQDPALVTDALVSEEFRINNSPGADGVFAALARYFTYRLDDDVVGEALAALSPRPPIELVWGAQDRSVPLAVGKEAARILKPAPLHVIEKAAHAPYFEQPAAFNALIAPFLARCAGKARAPKAKPKPRARSRSTTQGA